METDDIEERTFISDQGKLIFPYPPATDLNLISTLSIFHNVFTSVFFLVNLRIDSDYLSLIKKTKKKMKELQYPAAAYGAIKLFHSVYDKPWNE